MNDSLFEERLKKLNQLKELGVNPYPGQFKRTHMSIAAQAEAEKGVREIEEIVKKPSNEISLAGRLMSVREHGKLIFGQLQDGEGRMQICWMKDVLTEAQFKMVKLLDMGDFLGCSGELFITKHGEPTLLIVDYQLLSKSLRPLPDKWHGLKDREKCYRERHLDVLMNPETKKRFLFRSHFLKTLRDFYHEKGFLEIETPVLENISSGATARPFTTHHNALDIDVFLRIAAGELWQKTAMVAGFEKTFEVAKVFRNEGMDPSHLQEFTMVEHYAAYWNYEDNMRFTEEMFEHLFNKLLGTTKVMIKNPEGVEEEIDFKTPWPRRAFYDLIEEDSGIDVTQFENADALRAVIQEKGIVIEDMDSMGFGSLVDHLYKKVSRPKLVQPTFVTKHPVEMKPLARKNDENPRLCDTFQLLVNGWEVINAYSEIVDPLDQRERFEEQSKAKAGGDEEAMEMNEEYLRAMEHGMPPVSGWGMGIDRIVALLTQQENLRDVVLFPLMRPAQGSSAVFENIDDGKNIDVGLTYDQAKALFDEHVTSPAIRSHSLESEAVMRGLAKHFGANEEAWGILGLLHDLDWDPESGDVASHGVKSEEILRSAGMSEEGILVIKSHVYGIQGHNHPYEDKVRTRFIEHALAAGETVTGLIHAAALVRPEGIATAKVKSIKKKFKDKAFAAGANREVMREAEKLGLEMSEFFEIALNAMKEIAEELGI